MKSIRIVCADYYLNQPIEGLDVTFSEFHGAVIKQVPVIRIFGTDKENRKHCVHVHNVFPYFYIPCDSTDYETVNRSKYQIASSLDKAINTSFGSSSSNQVHIYKIDLVKGLPIYGYHPVDHQFFKIYLYNPALVRRTAGFLQNGTIGGRVYQPHECHIPYVLQFFIDYNLYGMSYLNCNEKDIAYRLKFKEEKANEVGPYKMAISEFEIDISAGHILNRTRRSKNSNIYANNPGIASIWDDELLRRENLSIIESYPLDVMDSQDRLNVKRTESDIFHIEAIKNKLDNRDDVSIDTTLDATIEPAMSPKEQRFNLSKLLANAVYPAECLQENMSLSLPKASSVSDHLSDSVSTEYFPHDTLYGTELATQSDNLSSLNETLEPMETELLELLQQMDEIEEEQGIDDDSYLGSLTQSENYIKSLSQKSMLSQTIQNLETSNGSEDLDKTVLQAIINDNISDSEDEFFQEFSQVMNNSDEEFENDRINQLDGADDPETDEIGNKTKRQSTSILTMTSPPRKLLLSRYKPLINTPPQQLTPKSGRRRLSEPCVNGDKSFISCEYKPVSKRRNQSGLHSLRIENTPVTKLKRLSKVQKNQRKEHILNSTKDFGRDKISFADLVEAGPSHNIYDNCDENSEINSSMDSKIMSFCVNSSDSDNECLVNQMLIQNTAVIEPELKAPTSNAVKFFTETEGFYTEATIEPFLSNPSDQMEQIEIGNQLLRIQMKTFHNYDDYKTIQDENKGLIHCRHKNIPYEIAKLKVKDELSLKQYLSGNTILSICPYNKAPSSMDVENWLKNKSTKKEIIKKSVELDLAEKDSPIKIRKEKLILIGDENENQEQTNSEIPLAFSSESKSLDISNMTTSLLHDSFGITGITLNKSCGSKSTIKNFQEIKSSDQFTNLSIVSMELCTASRDNLLSDPVFDSIECIFYCFMTDAEVKILKKGIILVDIDLKTATKFIEIEDTLELMVVETEDEMFETFIKILKLQDPDILLGYEIEMSSWGYFIERGQILQKNIIPLISRVPQSKVSSSRLDRTIGEAEDWNDIDSDVKCPGRILLDVWRLLRHEISLMSYTYENCVYHILRKRVPCYSQANIKNMWSCNKSKWVVIKYYMERVVGILKLLEHLDLIGRTSELASLFGIQFFEVLSRGSQYRVESMMLRISKPLNYICVSPSVMQRAHMKAPEYLPLILEPISRLYTDPVIVLDFQSLYPSMVIAYNYCFSTCLGRVSNLGEQKTFEFGASQLRLSQRTLKQLIDSNMITCSPCGVAFVKQSVRLGVLPQMLSEILNTRLMVKDSMKLHKTNKILQRVLHSRQLGLKLIANVTYGYTAANFSGRMPCVEVGDSIVSKGRETLERAIRIVESNERWGAKVIYGDTDSLFVICKGRSKEDAFKIGAEIAETVTNDNPKPVKLKLEKVYQPCILQTKKRYVGYMYESPQQDQPIYEAKGIETVRRDGCPVVAKMLEKVLRILFETKDISLIKRYVNRQFTKILKGHVNIQDLIFAKEFRGIKGYKAGACIPSLELTRKWLIRDRRKEPRRGERVPFIVVNGPPGVPLIRLVRSPHDYLNNDSLRINSQYYINKVIIPPLNRCLLLLGVDLNKWYSELPRSMLKVPYTNNEFDGTGVKRGTISHYFVTTNCIGDCETQTQQGICDRCVSNKTESVIIISNKIYTLEREYHGVISICESCKENQYNLPCVSLDCPVLFVHNFKYRNFKQTDRLRSLLNERLLRQ